MYLHGVLGTLTASLSLQTKPTQPPPPPPPSLLHYLPLGVCDRNCSTYCWQPNVDWRRAPLFCVSHSQCDAQGCKDRCPSAFHVCVWGGGGGTGFLVLTGGWLAGVGSANSTCSTLCITPSTCSTLCITTNALWSAPKNLCSTSSTQVRVPLVPCVRPQVSCKLFGVYPKCPANYSVVGDQAAPFWAQWTQF